MTITTIGDEKQITQIVKQLDKMIDTIEVHRLDVNNSVYRELVMFKIKVNKPEDSMEIKNKTIMKKEELVNIFDGINKDKISNEIINSLFKDIKFFLLIYFLY